MSLLGIDIGTTGCKAGVFSSDGIRLSQSYREYNMFHPRAGWSELDTSAVWSKTKDVITEAVSHAERDKVTALCVSSFGETFVPVTRGRRILDSSILCVDGRGGEHVRRLLEDFGEEKLFKINPNPAGPNFSLPKLLWLKEHRSHVYREADFFLLWSDFVAFMLGSEPVTNNSHANRTLLFNLDSNDWSDELLAWSGIPREKLAPIVPGGTVIGSVSQEASLELGLPRGAVIVAGGHDQCCNALGCGGISADRAVYGMGSYDCITPIFRKPKDSSPMLSHGLNIEHHVLPDLYVSFLFNQAGLLVKWFRDTFATPQTPYEELDAEMPENPTRLLALPLFDPPQWPRHIPGTAGALVGLKTDTTRGEILKAVQESAAFYFVRAVDDIRGMGMDTAEFIASGGGSKSDAALQIRADIFGIPIIRPQITEAGVLGAAMLAGIATGIFPSAKEAADLFVHPDRRFEPNAARHAVYREKHEIYERLYRSLEEIHKDLGRSGAASRQRF